jgi:hypothetical protein
MTEFLIGFALGVGIALALHPLTGWLKGRRLKGRSLPDHLARYTVPSYEEVWEPEELGPIPLSRFVVDDESGAVTIVDVGADGADGAAIREAIMAERAKRGLG